MPKYSKTAPSDSHVVKEDRFALLPVTSRVSIRDFVAANGITFAPGRGKFHLLIQDTINVYSFGYQYTRLLCRVTANLNHV